MRFQETEGRISILREFVTFRGTIEQFQRYEPEYVSSGTYIRIWTEYRSCLNDRENDYPDPGYSLEAFSRYCARIEEYKALQLQELAPPPETRDHRLQILNEDLHVYLSERGYDEGTQLSFQAIYIDLQELVTLSEAQTQVKTNIRQAWDFVRGVVLPYYYHKKAEIEVIEDVLNYSWDFHMLDDADPCVSLREIMGLLA